ncbi:CELL CYCLE CONTROL PROTEIN 50 [Salix koriyanagi]|uniref:ALA-interacting subunit n=1 Tax=Salix koriyanagi TaxID=2511006 RepID=A0A9Q0UEF2_9ROSI|nr:CELL CYCLE CONTROL PROTEIN 50 [Salix koriyanagi]
MEIASGPSTDSSAARTIPIDSSSILYEFKQQNLPACKPVLKPSYVITTFLLLGFIFLPIGLTTLCASRTVVEIVDRYDSECVPGAFRGNKVSFIKDSSLPKNCSRILKVRKHMKAPIYIYYQLDKLLSKSPKVCEKKNIAWKSDRDSKFGKQVYPHNFQNGTLIGGGKLDPNIPLSDQEDLIVWMRTAAFPSFRKLYGRIEEDLKADDVIVVHLMNNYNTYSFGGKKKLVLSTSSWLGGRNDFLGVAYISVGGSSIILSIVFLLFHIKIPR